MGSAIPDREPLMDNYQCDSGNDARSHGEETRTPRIRQVVPCVVLRPHDTQKRAD